MPKPAPDPSYLVVLRHADGGVALRDSGVDRDEVYLKALAEWKRITTRLGTKKAAGMTVSIYRRVESVRAH